MISSCSDHVRIMPQSAAIVNDSSAVFVAFLSFFGVPFLVAGAIFGGVGGLVLLLCLL